MKSSSLLLRRMETQDEAAFFSALSQWTQDPGFLFAQGYEPPMAFKEYLALLNANERGEQLPPGFVPATILGGFVGDALVGRVSIRHRLNDFLLKVGGHIGYGVLPLHRKNGYAKAMLKQALPVARELGIAQALLTCDEHNIGSIKTIEFCGGVLENIVEVSPEKPRKRRYWITL